MFDSAPEFFEIDNFPVHGKISGSLVLIGFGSIGRGMLPLIERHFEFDRQQLTVIDPDPYEASYLAERGIHFIRSAINRDNFREMVSGALASRTGQSFCVNLSVGVSSLDLMKLCRALGALYIDTVVEPWADDHSQHSSDRAARTNYALREAIIAEQASSPGGTTAVSCCGANPGAVSWFVKNALLRLNDDFGGECATPATRADWARLMQRLGVKGLHIAERDTQSSGMPRRRDTFVNTWSVDGFVSEALQPAELGWGTHETHWPSNANSFEDGCQASIYLDSVGAQTKVNSWCPTLGPQQAFLVTHNEAISISDYFTVGSGPVPEYRPTCHYAYHPSDDAILSLHEAFGKGVHPSQKVILDEVTVQTGMDELGVLLFGHRKNAYWYGSTLTIDEARQLAPRQNATSLQVTSAVLAGMVWALENPDAGIVEAEGMDFRRCLEIQRPYLGRVAGYYTDWTPLSRDKLFKGDVDETDPWQFKNVLID